MFHVEGEGWPILQNGETLQCHAKLDDLQASLSRIRQMLGCVDGGLTGKSEAGDRPYTASAFSASAEQLLADIRSDLGFLEIYLGQVVDAMSDEDAWRNASEAEDQDSDDSIS
jgi:hypothetical protein